MGIEDCIEKVQGGNKGITKEQAKDMITKAVNAYDQGFSEQKLLSDIDQIVEVRKEKIKKLRKLNELNDFVKMRDFVDSTVRIGTEGKHLKFMGKTLFDPMEKAFNDLARSHQQHVMVIASHNKQRLENRLADLFDYAKAPENQANIFREIANQRVLGEKPKASITGDDQAFKVAREIVLMQDEIHLHKRQAGSTIGYLEGRVTGNNWDYAKMSTLSEDAFYDLVKDIEWEGLGVVDKDRWIKFRDRFLSGNHTEAEDELHYGKMKSPELSGILDSSTSLAEFSGLSRKIKPTIEQYLKIEKALFSGENIIETIGLEIERDARIVGDLEFWGSKPVDQYHRIRNQIIEKTQGDKRFIRGGKHVLDTKMYTEELPANVFRKVHSPDHRFIADVFNLTRSLASVSKLSGSVLTSQMDVMTTAGQMVEFRNGKGAIFSEFTGQYKRIFESVGKGNQKALQESLGEFALAMETTFDEIISAGRYHDPEFASITSKGINKANRVVNSVFKLNGMEAFTRGSQRGSYVGLMNVLESNRGIPYAELKAKNPRILEMLDSNRITADEWDFIRSNGSGRTSKGYGILNPETLNKLPDEKFKEIFPDFTGSSLTAAKRKLIAKYNAALFKEAKTMTLMPDVIDGARLLGSSNPGTFTGETRRLMTQFKSYGFGYVARILAPMLNRGNAVNFAQYAAGSFAFGMFINQVKDLAKGKTPRNYLEHPELMVPVVGQILGLPYFDDLTMAFINDEFGGSSLSDAVLGPIPTDFLETTERSIKIGQKFFKGELETSDVGKATVRTIGQMPFFRNYPVLSPIYNNLIYNNLMESFDPGYKLDLQEFAQKRGQNFIVKP